MGTKLRTMSALKNICLSRWIGILNLEGGASQEAAHALATQPIKRKSSPYWVGSLNPEWWWRASQEASLAPPSP